MGPAACRVSLCVRVAAPLRAALSVAFLATFAAPTLPLAGAFRVARPSSVEIPDLVPDNSEILSESIDRDDDDAMTDFQDDLRQAADFIVQLDVERGFQLDVESGLEELDEDLELDLADVMWPVWELEEDEELDEDEVYRDEVVHPATRDLEPPLEEFEDDEDPGASSLLSGAVIEEQEVEGLSALMSATAVERAHGLSADREAPATTRSRRSVSEDDDEWIRDPLSFDAGSQQTPMRSPRLQRLLQEVDSEEFQLPPLVSRAVADSALKAMGPRVPEELVHDSLGLVDDCWGKAMVSLNGTTWWLKVPRENRGHEFLRWPLRFASFFRFKFVAAAGRLFVFTRFNALYPVGVPEETEAEEAARSLGQRTLGFPPALLAIWTNWTESEVFPKLATFSVPRTGAFGGHHVGGGGGGGGGNRSGAVGDRAFVAAAGEPMLESARFHFELSASGMLRCNITFLLPGGDLGELEMSNYHPQDRSSML